MSDVADVADARKRAFIVLYTQADVPFNKLVGSFVRFTGNTMHDVALLANVDKSHLYSCISHKSEASRSVRLAFEEKLGFDPWAEVQLTLDIR